MQADGLPDQKVHPEVFHITQQPTSTNLRMGSFRMSFTVLGASSHVDHLPQIHLSNLFKTCCPTPSLLCAGTGSRLTGMSKSGTDRPPCLSLRVQLIGDVYLNVHMDWRRAPWSSRLTLGKPCPKLLGSRPGGHLVALQVTVARRAMSGPADDRVLLQHANGMMQPLCFTLVVEATFLRIHLYPLKSLPSVSLWLREIGTCPVRRHIYPLPTTAQTADGNLFTCCMCIRAQPRQAWRFPLHQQAGLKTAR